MFKILIAEDDHELRRLFAHVLIKNGYTVKEVANGKEALDKFLASKPGYYDMVILDIQMPIMDGYQALKNIREIEKEHNIPEDKSAKIIMTTALNEEKNVKKAFELGCTVYCGKPIDVEQLKKILEKLGLI